MSSPLDIFAVGHWHSQFAFHLCHFHEHLAKNIYLYPSISFSAIVYVIELCQFLELLSINPSSSATLLGKHCDVLQYFLHGNAQQAWAG